MDVDSYIDSIASALAQRGRGGGRATAMIGAGFSRNAEKRTESARNFPLWRDIVRPLIDELLPPCRDCGGGENCPVDHDHAPEACKRRAHLFADAAGASGMMALGDKFESKKGSARLRAALESAVPDRDYGPGRAHQLLVRLPWADILTTNWDSLLERAVDAYDRSYDTVITVKQIASAVAPRIVKLHGCARSGTDLIFTEESFRTYPKDYAPFVSLVQQSLMENVVVLFGFSGADPNFRAWHGWVRDHLGSNLQPIYMVSLRATEPIDVNLMAGRLITHINLSERWPHLEDPLKIEAFLEEIQKRLRGLNINLDWPSYHRVKSSAADPASANAWRQRRQSYPGWLVAPAQNREDLVSHLEYAIHRANDRDPLLAGGLAPLTRPNGPRKGTNSSGSFLTDREGTALVIADSLRIALARPGEPLWVLLTTILAEALIDLFSIAFDEFPTSTENVSKSATERLHRIVEDVLMRPLRLRNRDSSEATLAAAIISNAANRRLKDDKTRMLKEVVFTLLPLFEVVEREARFRGNQSLAESLRYVLYFAGGNDAVRETAVRGALVTALERLDLHQIRALLGLWPDQHHDASSNLRHAAVLREIGKIREAFQEISNTVTLLRSLGNERRRGVAESSREAWAFYLYADLIERNTEELSSILAAGSTNLAPTDVHEELHERLDELETYRCDPRREIDRLARELDAETERNRLVRRVLRLEPKANLAEGDATKRNRQEENVRVGPADAFMILSETVGINIQQFCRGSSLAIMASRLVAATNRRMAINLLLRAGTPDDLPFAQTGCTGMGPRDDWQVTEVIFDRTKSSEDFLMLCGLLDKLTAPHQSDLSTDFIESSYLDRKFILLQHLIAGIISREEGVAAKQLADRGFTLACKIAYSPLVAATQAGWSNSLALFEAALKRFPFRDHAHQIVTKLLDLPIPTESNNDEVIERWPDPVRLLVAVWYPRGKQTAEGDELPWDMSDLGKAITKAAAEELFEHPILVSVLSDHERRWRAMIEVSSRARRLIVERRLKLIHEILQGNRNLDKLSAARRPAPSKKARRQGVGRSAKGLR